MTTSLPDSPARAFGLVLLTICAVLAVGCSNPESNNNGANPDGSNNVNLGDGIGDGVGDGESVDAAEDATKTTEKPCIDNELSCLNDAIAKICLSGKWELADQCKAPKKCNQGWCALPASCKPKEIDGCNSYDELNVCSDDGKAWLPIPCKLGELCVDGVCKETVCAPGQKICDGKTKVKTCKLDGSGFEVSQDCKSGAYCLGGTCVSLCETNLKVASNVGCEYWSIDLDNANDKSSLIFGGKTPQDTPHSVVVANPGIFDATVKWDLPAPFSVSFANNVVPAGKSREFKMPVMNVDGNELSKKAIHFTTDQPVVAYQFNPFNAEKAHSNDGSLLLPHNALGKEYFAITLGSTPMIDFPTPGGIPLDLPSQNGYFTVAAVMPGETTVTVTLSGKGYVKKAPVTNMPIKKLQTVSFKLQQYEVLSLEGHSEGFQIADLTGTRIKATKNVAVFGGHEEAVLGYPNMPSDLDNGYAEHIEEQLLPVKAWGDKFFLPKTSPRGAEPDRWIVMAVLPGTKLTTIPKIKGIDGVVLGPGQTALGWTTESFKLTSTGPVQVAQFIVGQEATSSWTGDPTMIVHPSLKHMRNDYFILTPIGYKHNWTSVTRPKGLDIKHNGKVLAASLFKPIGDGTWELAYVKVQPGQQRFEAGKDFGLSVYGYGSATAYGYPGGMVLK
ncbi:MAG: IgGFc-binding protein [Myxococcales bacterium]|nr:IgGFc-binding protein [Myxococcales bacterium]